MSAITFLGHPCLATINLKNESQTSSAVNDDMVVASTQLVNRSIATKMYLAGRPVGPENGPTMSTPTVSNG